MSLGEKHVNRHPSKWLYPHCSCTSNGSQFIDPDEYWSGGVCPVFGFSNSILLCFNVRGPNPRHKKVLSPTSVSNILTIFILAIFCVTPELSWVTDAAAVLGIVMIICQSVVRGLITLPQSLESTASGSRSRQ